MTTRRSRSGFTLMELLVVIFIISVLAALGALFIPNLDRNKGVPNAANQLQGWINLTRQQAMKNGKPTGIRIIHDGNGRATSIQYIEQPEPLSVQGSGFKMFLQTQLVFDPSQFPITNIPPNQGLLTVATLYRPTSPPPMIPLPPAFIPPNNFGEWVNWDRDINDAIQFPVSVQPGDYLELSGTVNSIAKIVRFTNPATPAPPNPTLPGQVYSQLVLDRVIEGTDQGQILEFPSSNFRVIRAPRPLVGEPMLQMHRDVYIDLTRSFPFPIDPTVPGAPQMAYPAFQFASSWGPNPIPVPVRQLGDVNYIDILFNSSGFVANAPTGKLILSVQHIDRPDRIFVTVYTRTGKVTGHYEYDVGGFDPYLNTTDGRNPGF